MAALLWIIKGFAIRVQIPAFLGKVSPIKLIVTNPFFITAQDPCPGCMLDGNFVDVDYNPFGSGIACSQYYFGNPLYQLAFLLQAPAFNKIDPDGGHNYSSFRILTPAFSGRLYASVCNNCAIPCNYPLPAFSCSPGCKQPGKNDPIV
jgi:hypothetical protein